MIGNYDKTDPAELRSAFAEAFGVRLIRWSGYNVTRMLRLTGDSPARVDEMWGILSDLGIGDSRRWISPGGVFDHGEFWGSDRIPRIMVGHPYWVRDEQRVLLAELGRFSGLLVAVDDRPSYYGHATHHVRIQLVEAHGPWVEMPGTAWTRQAAREARRVFAEEMGR